MPAAGRAAAGPEAAWTFGLWGGREAVGLADLSGLLATGVARERDRWAATYGGGSRGAVAPSDRAWAGGWQIDRQVGRGIALGLRAGCSVPRDVRASFMARGAADETEAWNERWSITLAPLLAGISGRWEPAAGLRLSSALWAGPVYASVTDRKDFSFSDPNTGDERTWSYVSSAAGAGGEVEAELQAGWAWSDGPEAWIGLGWRSARIGTLHRGRDADLDGDGMLDVLKGEPVRGATGGRLGVGATGVLVRAGIRLALH